MSGTDGARPRLLGGYAIRRLLGSGPQGPVYHAQSLVRGTEVALRVTKGATPAALSDVVRSTLAASLVRHPNLARVNGLGRAADALLRTTEFVDGPSLEELCRNETNRHVALLGTLHAARALQALHLSGLGHRHVDPAHVRHAGGGRFVLVGTELVEPPALDADRQGPISTVSPMERVQVADRADLGRLLDATTRRDAGGPRDPELAAVVGRLTADSPDPPYRDMPEAIRVLEGILGLTRLRDQLRTADGVLPLHACAAAFRDLPLARRKSQFLLGLSALWLLILALSVLGGRWVSALRLLVLAGLLCATVFVLNTAGRDDRLAHRLRELLLGLRKADRWIALGAGVLGLGVLVVTGLLGSALLLTVAAFILAAIWRLVVEIPLEGERQSALAAARGWLEELRWQGLDELELRRLAVGSLGAEDAAFLRALEPGTSWGPLRWRGSAVSWSAIDVLAARFRERLIDWSEAVLRSRRDARLGELIQETEEARLCAGGINLLTARRKSRRIAAALQARASEIREASRQGVPVPAIAPALEKAADDAEKVLLDHETGLIREPGWPRRLADVLLGARVRFVLGVLLLAGFVVWVQQNGLVTEGKLRDLAARAGRVSDLESARAVGEEASATLDAIHHARRVRPLDVPHVPQFIENLFQGLGPGVAGLILLVSVLSPGWRVGLFAMAGAAVALLGGRLGLPGMGPVAAEWSGIVLGLALALAGYLVPAGRKG